jgi:hypothetical protein
VVRNTILSVCDRFNGAAPRPFTPAFLGIGQSGRIDLPYLRQIFAALQPGKVYELMCHPGYYRAGEVADPTLLAYHRWEQELNALSGQPIRDLLRELHVEPIRYRDLANETTGLRVAAKQCQEVAHG